MTDAVGHGPRAAERIDVDQLAPTAEARFSFFVATLGRGQGRSRGLTREEAREAFAIALSGGADPYQLGAFLMLLRYRGEDADEISGLVEAARAAIGPFAGEVDLDWPSYGSGKTRGAPWFLLSALALARSGVRVLMHGTNEFTGGITVERGLAALGRPVAGSLSEASDQMAADRFAFLPLAALSPAMAHLIGLRRLLGLRSPVNTVARLLNPADARASVDGVFHPPYIALHVAVARRLDRERLLVLKGGGGEAERAAGKTVSVQVFDRMAGPNEMMLPALLDAPARETVSDTPERLAAVWRGDETAAAPVSTVIGTIAMGLLAIRPGSTVDEADRDAARIWASRF